jgi:signal transduction histidine kinase
VTPGRYGRSVATTAWRPLTSAPHRFLTSSWPWRSFGYVLSGVPVAIAVAVGLFGYLLAGLVLTPVLVGVLLLSSIGLLGLPIGSAERYRLRLMSTPTRPAPLSPHLAVELDSWRARLALRRRESACWRELGYGILLAFVIGPVNLIVAGLTLGLTATLLVSPVLVRFGTVSAGLWQADDPQAALPLALIAAPLWGVLSTYTLTALASLESDLARSLLGPREAELQQQLLALRRSRLDLVQVFETERRRIERHLHDGVQQRLVAMTMTLGLAETTMPDGESRTLVRRAQTQAEGALADLRDAVRGIHPRVLTDHGLAAAVLEITDRIPMPVSVQVALPDRLPDVIEQTAYFAISEVLTNVVKHARATQASVRGRTEGDRLLVEVADDGRGGAEPVADGGLAGLLVRLDALGGTLDLSSPAGGPTTLRMEFPCRVEP